MAAIGMILNCPKCGSMVQVAAPPGWQPPPEALAPKIPRWQDEVPRGDLPAGVGAASTPVIPGSASVVPGLVPGHSDIDGPGGAPVGSAGHKGRAHPASSSSSGLPSDEIAADAPAAGAWGWRQWSLAAGVPAAVLLASIGVWRWSRVPEPPFDEPPVAVVPAAPEQVDQVEPKSEPVAAEAPAPEAEPAAIGVPRRWLPTEAEAIVSLLPGELLRQPAAAAVLGRTASLWQAQVERLLGALAIEPGRVERVTWSATDLGQLSSDEWLASSVMVIQLAKPQGPDAGWLKHTDTLDWKLDEAPVHRFRGDAWPNPLAVVDRQTLITGPEPLLKELASRDDAALTKAGLETLVAGWDARDQVLCAVDLSSLRRAEAMPTWLPLVDIWHAEHDDWQLVCAMPQSLGLSVRLDEQCRAELDLACDGPSSAEQLQAALDRIFAAMQATIVDESDGLTQKLLAGQIDTAGAAELNRLLTSSAAALEARQSGVREALVWFRMQWQGDLPRLSGALMASIPQIEASRLAAARTVDEEHHRMLLLGLQGYEKSTGAPPAGAAGAQLLPPDTRLSWLATLLPYYDHLDWHEQLNFGRAWNDAANQRVTRRPLELVVNPALGQATTKAGFPATHYVGVAGLGDDAGNLEATDPRAGVFGFRPRVRRGQIPDGASHTIALAGVEQQLGPWAAGGAATVRGFTQPPYINGPDGFGSGQPDGMMVGMADGSVRFLSKDIDPAVLAALVTINGGERIADQDLVAPAPRPEPDQLADEPRPPADEAGEMPDEAPSEDEPALPDAGAEAEVAERLAFRIPQIDYKRTTLSGLIELLSQISTVPITLDIEALSAAGVKPDAKVAVTLDNATIGEILSLAIAPYDLRYVIVGEHVVVTDRRRGEEERSTVRYDVADLATGGSDGLADLEALVTRFVAPTSWQEAGGTGVIEPKEQTLVVEQTASAQRQVADFLARLRLARSLPVGRGGQPAATLATRFAQAKDKLAAPVTATFRDPTALKQIASQLGAGADVKIVFDGLALATTEISPATQATLVADQQPLGAALDQLLKPLRLTYRVVDGKTLEITTARDARDDLELEFYAVKKLLAADGSAEEFMERLRSEVAPESWDDVGGGAVLAIDAPSSYLMVLQSQPVQRELEAWLAKQK